MKNTLFEFKTQTDNKRYVLAKNKKRNQLETEEKDNFKKGEQTKLEKRKKFNFEIRENFEFKNKLKLEEKTILENEEKNRQKKLTCEIKGKNLSETKEAIPSKKEEKESSISLIINRKSPISNIIRSWIISVNENVFSYILFLPYLRFYFISFLFFFFLGFLGFERKEKRLEYLKEEIKNIKRKNNKTIKDNKTIRKINSFCNNIKKIILLIIIISCYQMVLTNNKINFIESKFSNITLKINGNGTKNVFSSDIYYFRIKYYPEKIYINGMEQTNVNYSYYFNQTDNQIELIWNKSINFCRGMFYFCSDITEIDLSNFDSSKVKNTDSMFKGCSKLTSLNLTNFNTSNVEDMADMFHSCSSLYSLDLSNFDTSKVEGMSNMFYGCKKLEYVNLKNFNENKLVKFTDIFYNVSDNIVVCLNESNSKIFSEINKTRCYTIDCSDDWKINQKKIDNETLMCIDDSNNTITYEYEYTETYTEIYLNESFINNSTINTYYYDNKTNNENIFCNISDFFNESRTCKINLETVDEEIVEFLNSEIFMQLLSNNTNNLKNKSLIMEQDNETFSISLSSEEKTIQLGECEKILRDNYDINANKSLIIYKHEIEPVSFLIPIINFKVFDNNNNNYNLLNLTCCFNKIIEYKISVNITGDNTDKYNPLSDYYNDNCSYVSEKSLYDRKKEFNIDNLSICQKGCNFSSFNFNLSEVTCVCPVISHYINKSEELLYKFELKENDMNKCLNNSNEFCSYKDIFNETVKDIICKINTTKIHQEIIEGLNSQLFRENFINMILENQNNISFKNDDYNFSLANSQYEENIQIRNCETLLRSTNNISENESLYIYKYEYIVHERQKKEFEYEIFNKNYFLDKSTCKDDHIPSLIELMALILKNLSAFINPHSLIQGDDFNALILSSNDMDVKTQLKNGISAVDLGNCTEKIKEFHKIPSEENLVILNVESQNNKSKNGSEDNNDNDNSFNLGKSVQLQIYDYSGNQLNLSVCNEDIKVLMNLKDVKGLDMDSSKKYSEQGIDVYNPSDKFFNEFCHKYDNVDKIDIIIDDRRSDIYQNATFCQDGCHYNGVDYDLMAAKCLCDSSVLENDEKDSSNDDKSQKEILTFKTLTKSFISNLLKFNFEVIFCYNLVFDTEILAKNIGFYCMLTLNALQIIFLCIFSIKKLKPIKNFMSNYSPEKKDENAFPPKRRHSKGYIKDNNISNNNTYIKNDNSKLNNKEKNKRRKSNLNSFSLSKLSSKNNLNNNYLFQQDNLGNIDELLNINNEQNKKGKTVFYSKKEKDKINQILSENKNSNEIFNKIKDKNKSQKRRKSHIVGMSISNIKTTGEKQVETKKPKKKYDIKTEDEIEEMDYEEAIIYDKRPYIKMYWSSLVDSQIILETFFTESNLNLLIIKISLFIFFFEMDFSLNALFYSDEYISEAYHNNGVLDFVSGLPKAIYSFLATLILTNLVKMLSNSKSELMKLMLENSKNKKYLSLINEKLKKLKLKLIIYFILIFILGLLFLYYVSAFCAVYRYSQKYWFFGCLESFGMDFLTAFVTTLFLSFLKFVAIRKKIKFLFTLSNIIGIFL